MDRRTFLLAAAGLAPTWGGAAPTRLARAWLGEPDRHYAHAALGTMRHPGTLWADVAVGGRRQRVMLTLPPGAVFEDRVVRRADLDGDGLDEIVLVQSSDAEGAALVVIGVDEGRAPPRLGERARAAPVGRMRWLNPVGCADFDGDGRLEIASVATPHIGGRLELYRYAPPRLELLATEGDVCNHVFGTSQQQLALVIRHGSQPAVLVPDQARRRLRTLAYDASGRWRDAAPSITLEAPLSHLESAPGGARATLENGEQRLLR